MLKYKIGFGEDYIKISDKNGEVVYWNEEEWKENSSIVFSIANAVKLACEGKNIRKIVGKILCDRCKINIAEVETERGFNLCNPCECERLNILKEGCGEDMVNFKCGELKPNYFNGKKFEVLYCLTCKAKINIIEELKLEVDK